LEAFEQAGFYGVTILERQEEPWRTVEGIEFRSMTGAAYKGQEGPCRDQKHAVVYDGPFRQVGGCTTATLTRCLKSGWFQHRAGARSPFGHIESFSGLAGQRISTDSHCFGCTAGAGSSCGGSLA
jgi:hypothetical protein